MLSLSLRLYEACKLRLEHTKARLARELLPVGLENFRRQLVSALHVGKPQYLCSGKAREATVNK